MDKDAGYAEKRLAAYKLGMSSNGSIVGVRVECPAQSCAAAQAQPATVIFYPDDAPRFPLPECTQKETCPCVYRPVMTYEVEPDEATRLHTENKARIQAEKAAKRSARKSPPN